MWRRSELALLLALPVLPLASPRADSQQPGDPPDENTGGASTLSLSSDLDKNLERLASKDGQVELWAIGMSLSEAFRLLGTKASLTIVWRDEPPEGTLSRNFKGSLRQVLVELAEAHGLSYNVFGSSLLVVYRRNPGNPDRAGDVVPPVLIPETKARPRYPKSARKARMHGTVILEIVVRPDGRTCCFKVLKGIPGWVEFERNAIKAVQKWRYKPATQNGQAVAVCFTVRADYSLK